MVDLGFFPSLKVWVRDSDQVMIGLLFVGFQFIVSKYTKSEQLLLQDLCDGRTWDYYDASVEDPWSSLHVVSALIRRTNFSKSHFMNRGPCRPFLVYVHKYISYNPGPSYVPKIIYDMFGPKKGYLYRVWSHEGWDMSQLFSQEGLSILIIITRFDPVRVNEIQYLLDLSTCILFTSEVCLMWIRCM